MTTFTVWKFDDPDGADHAAQILRNAEADGLVKVEDHAVVRWPAGADQPTTAHGHEGNWRGAGWGAILGLLIWRALRKPLASGPPRPWLWAHARVTLLIVVLYAATDEFHQVFVPSRQGTVEDVLIDTCGAALALTGLWTAGRWRGRW